jgi:ABC-2 type transport system permease protein
MVGCGLAVGWRPHASAAGMLAAAGLLILMRYAVSWAGVFIGLAVRNEETADQLVPLIFPLTMISNTFVPTTHMPAWLRVISNWNPVSALVAATRQLLGSVAAPGRPGAWPLAHPVPATLAWAALLLALFVPLSVRRYATARR